MTDRDHILAAMAELSQTVKRCRMIGLVDIADRLDRERARLHSRLATA